MIPLLIGLVCLLAALHVAGSGMDDEVRNRGALAWFAVVAALTLGQLWLGSDALERYRFTLLGFRYQLVGADGAVRPDTVEVAGDDAADLWVPGAGEEPPLVLQPVGSDDLEAVQAQLRPDAGAVALVEEPGGLSTRWRVLGGVPLEPGDAIQVTGSEGAWTLRLETASERLELPGGRGLPLPWVAQPRIRVTLPGGEATGGEVTVPVPPLEGSILDRMTGTRPSVFQRTYPLSDLVAVAADSAGVPPGLVPLTSFFYWSEGTLHLAHLDSEVTAPGEAPPLPVWEDGRGGRRLLVAGLPYRDLPEPDLVLPERYGIRPLRTFRIGRNGPWMDASLIAPEIRVLDRAALEELRLPGALDPDGRPTYRIRLTPGRDAPVRQAVVFDAAPDPFAAAGQAVFRLPEATRAGTMDVLAPAGLARWETGRPLSLGTGDRALLVRVDGLGTSGGWWLAHLGAFLLLATVFLRRPMTGPVFALALTVTGLLSLRLLLGVAALADRPFVQEGQQIGLWLLAFLPWAVVALAEVARPEVRRSEKAWLHPVLYAVAVAVLGVALFAGSPAKQLVAAALPAAVALLRVGIGGGWRPAAAWSRTWERLRAWEVRHPRLSSGWALGLMLLLLRVVLEGLGWREQLTLGGTRIGVSVLYTPLVVLVLAWLFVRHDRRLQAATAATAGGGTARAAAGALLDVGGFLLLALVGVGAWVSDFGVPLVLLPGALLLLALLGVLRAPGGRTGRATVLALGFPLVLFLLVQTAPPLLSFAWDEDLRSADLRMGEWNRNELLLLERGDPQALQMIGQRRSEALAIMRETMRSYTRGNLTGKGFLQGRVGDEIAETATREHTVSALLASQWGLPGTAGLLLLLMSLLPPVGRLLLRDRTPAEEAAGVAQGEAQGEEKVQGEEQDWWSATRAPATSTPSALRGPDILLLLGLPLAVLAVVGFVLPSPWNASVVGLVTLAAAVVLVGPAFGLEERWLWGVDEAGSSPEDPAAGARGTEREGPREAGGDLSRLVAATALLTLAGAGIYMVLANYGLTFFTGKNVYLLGLDSLGDALEGTALLGMAALALGVYGALQSATSRSGGADAWSPHSGEASGWGEADAPEEADPREQEVGR